VIAVPAASAQHVVNIAGRGRREGDPQLSRPGAIKVPRGVKLKSLDLTVSLESLSFFLAQGETVE
jgi:NADH/NAD ratio-sensing transcriptional regulator Rex